MKTVEDLRPPSEQLLSFLKNAEYFKSLDESVLIETEKAAQWKVLASRQVLMNQGEQLSEIYLLISGKLHFEKTDEDGVIVASGEFNPGDSIGELTLLRDSRALATIYSVRNCHLMSLDRKYFKDLLLKNPELLFEVSRKAITIADRSLSVSPEPARYTALALIPLDSQIPLDFFSKNLAASFEKFGRTVCITRSLIEEELGAGRADLDDDDPLIAENISWMSRYVSDFDFVLLEADFLDTSWSKMCVQEADRILLIGSGGGVHTKTKLEEKIFEWKTTYSPKSELVLLHQKNSKPRNTKNFLNERDVVRHHHVWIDDLETYARLVRILSGQSIGLVLGGGGVRAATQIGLIKAFLEEGIPIDHIGGTSIGALVGAMYALGLSTNEMKGIIKERIVKTNLFNDYVAPFVSLIRGRKYAKFLKDIYSTNEIEDMSLDFFSVATNLTKGRLETRDRGLAWLAVRASASLPAILPPLIENENLYVDGGLLDNVPGEVMRSRGVSKIIAVDVSSAQNTERDVNLGRMIKQAGETPSFWKVLWNKLTRSKNKIASLGDVIVRSMVVGSRERSQKTKESVDVYVRMPVDDWGMLEFEATSELVKIGYDHSRKHIKEWKKSLGINP